MLTSEADFESYQLALDLCQAALSRRKAEVQGAVLADLLAMWLAGHMNNELREQLLHHHIAAVRELIPVNERIILERAKRGSH